MKSRQFLSDRQADSGSRSTTHIITFATKRFEYEFSVGRFDSRSGISNIDRQLTVRRAAIDSQLPSRRSVFLDVADQVSDNLFEDIGVQRHCLLAGTGDINRDSFFLQRGTKPIDDLLDHLCRYNLGWPEGQRVASMSREGQDVANQST